MRAGWKRRALRRRLWRVRAQLCTGQRSRATPHARFALRNTEFTHVCKGLGRPELSDIRQDENKKKKDLKNKIRLVFVVLRTGASKASAKVDQSLGRLVDTGHHATVSKGAAVGTWQGLFWPFQTQIADRRSSAEILYQGYNPQRWMCLTC